MNSENHPVEKIVSTKLGNLAICEECKVIHFESQFGHLHLSIAQFLFIADIFTKTAKVVRLKYCRPILQQENKITHLSQTRH